VDALARFASVPAVVDLIRRNRDVKLLVEVETTLKLARYQPGRIEFEPTGSAARDLAPRLAQRLQIWTGVRWAVTVVNEGGAQTIAEVRDAEEKEKLDKAYAYPMVQAVLEAFPKAKITDIRTAEQLTQSAAVEALPEVDDEWDPFEED
jgi:DNA polymerase-3 subunit gamma/tau